MRNKWNEWMTGGEIQFTASSKRKRASYEMVVNWVNDVWQQVAADKIILKGFKECGYIGYDNVNSLHSCLRETIVNREIPPEVLAEVNEFLIQLEAGRMKVRRMITMKIVKTGRKAMILRTMM